MRGTTACLWSAVLWHPLQWGVPLYLLPVCRPGPPSCPVWRCAALSGQQWWAGVSGIRCVDLGVVSVVLASCLRKIPLTPVPNNPYPHQLRTPAHCSSPRRVYTTYQSPGPGPEPQTSLCVCGPAPNSPPPSHLLSASSWMNLILSGFSSQGNAISDRLFYFLSVWRLGLGYYIYIIVVDYIYSSIVELD